MIKEFLNKTKNDLTNINEVYNEFLINYNPDNIKRTELIFIDSFLSADIIEKDIREYFRNKRKNVVWQNLDNYNHYLTTKRFGFTFLKTFKKNDFNEIIKKLNEQKNQFFYNYNKLNTDEKLEYKNDYIDQLEKLIKKQEHSKYKELIKEQIQGIKDYNFTPLNIQIQKYYNCIRRVDFFKKFLEMDNDMYYGKRVNFWLNYRNEKLLEHEILKSRKGILMPFNNYLSKVIRKIIRQLKNVIDWKENQIELHPNSLEVGLSCHLVSFKSTITAIKMNYDNDKLLAYQMQKYCINGFDLMLNFIKEELLINFEKMPTYNLIQNVIDDFKNVIDIEDVKIFLESKNLQKETDKPDKPKKELHITYFKNNAFEVWQSMFDEFNISNTANGKKRTDVKFMFEIMKKKSLIHKTINQKIFLEWITSTYDGLIIEKTSNHSITKVRTDTFNRAMENYNA